jgi:hypothetical protein
MAIDTFGTMGTQFSPQYLALQNEFCCDTGNLKIIRWNGCKPGIYKGSKNLFTSDDLAMCSWFQAIDNYSFLTIDFSPGETAELQLNNVLYLFGKTKWEANSLDSLKHLEIAINQQGGVIGSTIPFNIGVPEPPILNYSLIRDRYEINTGSMIDGPMIINNCSPYQVSLSILYAY